MAVAVAIGIRNAVARSSDSIYSNWSLTWAVGEVNSSWISGMIQLFAFAVVVAAVHEQRLLAESDSVVPTKPK